MKRIFVTLIIGLFLISMVSAQLDSIGVFKQGDPVHLVQSCASCTYNNVTAISFPNGTIFNLNVEMGKNGSFYNYTYDYGSVILGTYLVNGIGDLDAVNTTWSYDYTITTSGSSINEGNSMIIFLSIVFFLVLGILCFLGFYKSSGEIGIAMPVKWTLFIFGFIFFLTSINLISVALGDALVSSGVMGFFDFFTAVSFYLFWFAFGLLGVLWFLTTLQTLLLKKNQNQMRRVDGIHG